MQQAENENKRLERSSGAQIVNVEMVPKHIELESGHITELY